MSIYACVKAIYFSDVATLAALPSNYIKRLTNVAFLLVCAACLVNGLLTQQQKFKKCIHTYFTLNILEIEVIFS